MKNIISFFGISKPKVNYFVYWHHPNGFRFHLLCYDFFLIKSSNSLQLSKQNDYLPYCDQMLYVPGTPDFSLQVKCFSWSI